MGIFKHVINKSIDTHFDKKVAANVGVNATRLQSQQMYTQQNTNPPQYQSIPNNPNIKIANPQLYANWQAQQQKKQQSNNQTQPSDTLMIKKAELMTELMRQGKTPDEALEFANNALNIKEP